MDPIEWRIEHGLTQAAAADLFGVSQSYLSLLESGVRLATVRVIERVSIATGGSITYADWIKLYTRVNPIAGAPSDQQPAVAAPQRVICGVPESRP